jgi:hypothetical protein
VIPLSWLEGAGVGFDEGRRRPLVVSYPLGYVERLKAK